MPSLRHQFLAFAVPRLRRAGDLVDEATERARLERDHAALPDPAPLPTGSVRRFARRYELLTVTSAGPTPFPVHTLTPRGTAPRTTLFYCHGGGFVGGIDRVHVPYALRLGRVLHARVVIPDYPLAPEHSWADSHQALVEDLRRRLDDGQRVVIAGDSAGGGLALALAETLRDQGGAQPSELLLISPWVDLTTSTPETEAFDRIDPWLHLSKLRVYARWWAGSQPDLFRPEVSPALGDLDGLPRTLMFCGSRDLLVPGCRLLADRAAESDWDLTYLEAPGLIHVFPLLPLIPEARVAWRATQEFLTTEPSR